MIGLYNSQRFSMWLGMFFLLFLTGCGGGGGGDGAPANSAASSSNSSDLSVVSGSGGFGGVGSGGTGSSDSGSSAGSPATVEIVDTIVTWGAPQLREDGGFLRDIDILGYRVYYGLESGDYQENIEVASSADPEVDLIDLPSGVYFLVITSIDVDGRESLFSDEFSVTL